MTGLPDFNYPAFFEAEARLVALGFEVLNPARKEIVPGKSWGAYLGECLDAMDEAHEDHNGNCVLVLLDGWYASRGSRHEILHAQILRWRIADFEKLIQEEAGCELFTLVAELARRDAEAERASGVETVSPGF